MQQSAKEARVLGSLRRRLRVCEDVRSVEDRIVHLATERLRGSRKLEQEDSSIRGLVGDQIWSVSQHLQR
jgi:hypothetical protein